MEPPGRRGLSSEEKVKTQQREPAAVLQRKQTEEHGASRALFHHVLSGLIYLFNLYIFLLRGERGSNLLERHRLQSPGKPAVALDKQGTESFKASAAANWPGAQPANNSSQFDRNDQKLQPQPPPPTDPINPCERSSKSQDFLFLYFLLLCS